MSDSNPFNPPKSEVSDTTQNNDLSLNKARATPISHGAVWVIDGFRYFFNSPFTWLLISLLYIFVIVVLSIIPIASIAVYIFMPILFAGFMRGCQQLDYNERVYVSHLFAGFAEKGGKLAILGVVYLASNIILIIVIAAFVFITLAIGSNLGNMENLMQSMFLESEQILLVLLIILVALALFIPITMLFWFAPALAMFHDVTIIDALKQSFMGCLKNILPYLLYSIVLSLVYLIALIPIAIIVEGTIIITSTNPDFMKIFIAFLVFGVETLILIPMFMASIYAAYKDIFEY